MEFSPDLTEYDIKQLKALFPDIVGCLTTTESGNYDMHASKQCTFFFSFFV